MADSIKWQEAHQVILAALDISAEYQSLGLRLAAGAKPRASGWLAAHGIGREDKNPSAEINVGDGPARGRYRDFGSGGGQTVSLFDFAATHGHFGGDWREARKHYARQTKTKLPHGAEELPADRFEFFPPTFGLLLNWSDAKPGTTPQALIDAGVVACRWPKRVPAELAQCLLAFPMFGAGLLDLEPIGWHTVAASGRKIRKFKGQGNEPEHVKTLTHGHPGLMNVAGLRRLPRARVVWIVEGLTDMLALHAAIPTELSEDHVVLSAGGCTYHPQPEWLPHFSGKDVRVCFDNDAQTQADGSSKNPGQLGAKVWVAAMIPVASSVRNVLLDLVDGGTKIDLRDWLNAGRTYRELFDLSQTFPPIKTEDREAQLAPYQALLENLGCLVLGQIEGSETVEVFSRPLQKTTQLKDLDKLSYAKLILALGGEIVGQRISASREPQPDRYSVDEVRNAIAREAAQKWISNKSPIGAGVWPVERGLVLVRSRSADMWNGRCELEQVTDPLLRGQRIDYGSAEDWYDREQLVRYLSDARDVDWRREVTSAAEELFARWDNWAQPSTPTLLTGLVLATWLQTTWMVRPLVGVLGPTDCGKSTLIQHTLPKLFGPLAAYVAKSSEPGIRQVIGTSGKVLIIDEFEDDFHRRKILELLRTSTNGSEIARGSASQKKGGVLYGLKHIAWVGAINLSLSQEADRNRFILLELNELEAGHPRTLIPEPEERLRVLGFKLLASALVTHHAAAAMAEALSREKTGVGIRATGIHAVPVAAFYAARGEPFERAAEYLRAVLAEHEVGERAENDQIELLRAILEAVVMLPGGNKTTVSELLERRPPVGNHGRAIDAREVLRTCGIRLLTEPDRLFLVRGPLMSQILKGTQWANWDITQSLSRIKGAHREIRRMPHAARGISIPLASIRDLLPDDLDF